MPESVPASKQQAGIKAKTAEAKEIREEKVIAPESPDAQVKAGAQGARKETEEPATPPVRRRRQSRKANIRRSRK